VATSQCIKRAPFSKIGHVGLTSVRHGVHQLGVFEILLKTPKCVQNVVGHGHMGGA
jgi:hypothetical protein